MAHCLFVSSFLKFNSILFYFLSWASHYSLKKLFFPSLCNFSLFGHENLLFGFQYIHNISLSTFFLVDCWVVNASLLQPVGVEIFYARWNFCFSSRLRWKFVRITILWFAFLKRSYWKWSHWFSTLNSRYSWIKTDHSLKYV